jgi:putative heme-binding domain-containing protein
MDEFLDYALWKTLRDLEPYWLGQVKSTPDYFGTGRKLAFALKASRDPYAVARLTRMYDAGDVPESYRQDVLDVVADYGSPEELQIIFDHALAGDENVDALLATLERAAQHSGAQVSDAERHSDDLDEGLESPGRRPAEGLERIETLLHHADETIAASAVRLAGFWRMDVLRDELVRMAESEGTSTRMREASVEALASMGDTLSREALVAMTRPDRPLELRLVAASTLPSIDLELAAETAVDLFGELPEVADPSSVFESLFAQGDGPEALANALEGEAISAGAARTGLEVIRSKGWSWLRSNEFAPAVQTELERIGGPLPPPKIPQNPSADQIHRLEIDIKAEGDAARGERVYRRSELACMVCHAIGGAGGKAGPDLSSLGASAPLDYIIEAVLVPDNAVKDGYSLINVTKTDGTVVSGMLVRESNDEIVLRNIADEEVSISMNQVADRAITHGSLMPAGLTAPLEREEFMDLMRFLSELGETEEFIPESGWVRRWRALADTDGARRALDEQGAAAVVGENSEQLPWQERYSTVSGGLPLEDLPAITMADGRTISLAWFEVEVRAAGSVELAVSGTEGLWMWVDSREIDPLQEPVSLDLSEGTHRIVVGVDPDVRQDALRIRIVDGSSGRVRAVLGK